MPINDAFMLPKRVRTMEQMADLLQAEQTELTQMQRTIAALEQQIQETEAQLGACTSDYVKLQELSEKKSALETQLEEKMERWVYLNDLAERIANGEMV